MCVCACVCACVQAGSDVANMITTATKSADGTHYIVNGTKKWITGAMHADYFVTAVRTGDGGQGGISVLLIERGMEGVETRPIKTSYSATAGTALLMLEGRSNPAPHTSTLRLVYGARCTGSRWLRGMLCSHATCAAGAVGCIGWPRHVLLLDLPHTCLQH